MRDRALSSEVGRAIRSSQEGHALSSSRRSLRCSPGRFQRASDTIVVYGDERAGPGNDPPALGCRPARTTSFSPALAVKGTSVRNPHRKVHHCMCMLSWGQCRIVDKTPTCTLAWSLCIPGAGRVEQTSTKMGKYKRPVGDTNDGELRTTAVPLHAPPMRGPPQGSCSCAYQRERTVYILCAWRVHDACQRKQTFDDFRELVIVIRGGLHAIMRKSRDTHTHHIHGTHRQLQRAGMFGPWQHQLRGTSTIYSKSIKHDANASCVAPEYQAVIDFYPTLANTPVGKLTMKQGFGERELRVFAVSLSHREPRLSAAAPRFKGTAQWNPSAEIPCPTRFHCFKSCSA